MKPTLTIAALAASALPFAAAAQSMPSMPGMTMPARPAPAKPKAKSKPKPVPGRPVPHRHQAPADTAPASTPPTEAQPAPMPEMTMPMAEPTPRTPTTMPQTPMAMVQDDMPGMAMGNAMYGEGSGTARLPASEGAMHGLHVAAGDWMLMLHGYAWGVYTDQAGPRGGKEVFVESMAMLQARRDLGSGAHLQLRSMLSLEPLMGAKGYPNLFATGESADGTTHLIDRQHPHDLFMELAARLDVDIGKGASLFVYGGPVAEPALGPSAFMHRGSAQYEPLSPITHHWFDSTHISYGVVTGGIATPHWQIEGSAFRGREPDQHRWNIETPKLDSWSVRATWTPSPDWAVQVSHGFLKSPEQLEPGIDENRTTASVQYAHDGLSTTFGYSIKDKQPGRKLSAFLAEANYDLDRHNTLFGRFENVANDELFPDPADPLHDRKFRVSRLEGGYAYRLPIAGPVDAALGGAVGVYAKPAALDAAYGKFPVSFSLFVKLSLGH